MKIATIVGVRPHFIKASIVSPLLKVNGIDETIIHTKQHYDDDMDIQFFRELSLPKPKYEIEYINGNSSKCTAAMIERLLPVIISENPDYVMVYGDTNTTIAGALAGNILNIPVVHIEAGIRCFNRNTPEEINRILTDKISSLLLTPTLSSTLNLKNENVSGRIINTGDVTLDIWNRHNSKSSCSTNKYKNKNNGSVFATIHRAENIDNHERLILIIQQFGLISQDREITFSIHPRTSGIIEKLGLLIKNSSVKCVEPLSYYDTIQLINNASVVVTDSGGIQRESYYSSTPCVTVRNESEWPETYDGWNVLCEPKCIYNTVCGFKTPKQPPDLQQFGNGDAARKIVDAIRQFDSLMEN